MHKCIYSLVLAGSLACAGSAFAIQPIKGSLTFNDGSGVYPYQNMLLTPGQTFSHRFQNETTGSGEAEEFYRVSSSGELILISRRFIDSDRPEPGRNPSLMSRTCQARIQDLAGNAKSNPTFFSILTGCPRQPVLILSPAKTVTFIHHQSQPDHKRPAGA